jgi:phage major head subunit gpT-like protein
MANNISIQNSLIQGIFRDLQDTWKNYLPIYDKLNSLFSRSLPDNTVRTAQYAWKEAVPFPKLWEFDQGRSHQTFQDRKIEVAVHAYEATIDVRGYDLEDDQIGDGKSHIQTVVERFLQIPQKLYAEYLNAVADLNPQLLNAFDGVGLFSTIDGNGDARFGATGGNIVTGSGVSVSAFTNDLFEVQERALSFLDTKNQILNGPDDVKFSNFHVVVPKELNEVAQKVAQSEYLRTDLSNNTSENNILKGQFEVHINNLLTDSSDWYVIINHRNWKPFVVRQRRDVRAIWADMTNSDRARETNQETLYADLRTGISPWAPWSIVKVNN